MIQRLFTTVFILTYALANAQANTEVYLFDLTLKNGTPVLSNPKNISNNEGYDNQPSFWDDDTVLFSSTREGQTDILRFNINLGSTTSWLTNTPTGSEYSPLRIPGKNAISAIRLDLDGLQRLYEYDLTSGDSSPISNQKIGYHVWFNDHILVATVLVENRMDLMVLDMEKNTTRTVQKNVGRSLHNIPGTRLVSFIAKANKTWEIKSLDPETGISQKIADTYQNQEDICWLDQNSIITGVGKTLLVMDTASGLEWESILTFQQEEINNISRISVNQSKTRLAFVADESPAMVVQRQVEAFNKEDLEGFISCYSDNVLVQRFPKETMYLGKTKMTESYERFFANTNKSSVEVVKRIVIGNKVIDEETTLVDGRKGHQVALYEVKNGLITSMTFIFPDQPTADTETIVQEQLDAYNARDADAFMDTYSDNVKLYMHPDKLLSEGKKTMSAQYRAFFENTPDLHCDIKKRIVIGNKVIDEESVVANGTTESAVAIYEVENGKISKVTFIQ
ncbi:hypothetical protein SAMN04487891_10925 [Flagellimonas taeanensis]|uniref:SnoaL-like domain-containing protein n=1 Tax=Flagellimonas taeanensis TaxID=1005926 RepID=A0A1M7AFA9_9FLAO|nr:nuclear transport factor 2 family protein [Allomuricauda taeanensis]SFC33256.1 hypothetical protein SAMN04487891_10925 [Allomuricauda taeanensis]SHL41438.1 hypothetical protein SAMN05216293_3394 [Allomuricauda taeanensis]